MSYTDIEYKFKKIGKNVQIGKNVYFRYPEEIVIGDNVIIDEFCSFTTALEIGSYIHIGPHCSVIGGKKSKLIMGNFSGLSAGCRIACSTDSYLGDGLTNPTIPTKYRASVTFSTVEIQKHVVLGTGCVVHPGVIIGEGAAIGSMSLITKNIAPWGVYIGIPAKQIKERVKGKILEYERQLLAERKPE